MMWLLKAVCVFFLMVAALCGGFIGMWLICLLAWVFTPNIAYQGTIANLPVIGLVAVGVLSAIAFYFLNNFIASKNTYTTTHTSWVKKWEKKYKPH